MGNGCTKTSHTNATHTSEESAPDQSGVDMGGILSRSPKNPAAPTAKLSTTPKSKVESNTLAATPTVSSSAGVEQPLGSVEVDIAPAKAASETVPQTSVQSEAVEPIKNNNASAEPGSAETRDEAIAASPAPASSSPSVPSSVMQRVESGPMDPPPPIDDIPVTADSSPRDPPADVSTATASSSAVLTTSTASDESDVPPPPAPDPEPLLSPPIPPPGYKGAAASEVDAPEEGQGKGSSGSGSGSGKPSVGLLARRVQSQRLAAASAANDDVFEERYSEDLRATATPPKPSNRRGSTGVIQGLTTGKRSKAIASSIARRAQAHTPEPKAAPPVARSIDVNRRAGLSISLMEHQHTFFCERKERVCTAAGKLQELETLMITGDFSNLDESDIVWTRSGNPMGINAADILDSRGSTRYALSAEDVGHFVGFRIVSTGEVSEEFVGPVLPGPPRLLDLQVVGECAVGQPVVAVSQYIGGREGASEYWWLRIDKDGNRENIRAPTCIDLSSASTSAFNSIRNSVSDPEKRDSVTSFPSSAGDPRVYFVTAADEGAKLKVKCRPVRDDGVKGEVFTSKASSVVMAPPK